MKKRIMIIVFFILFFILCFCAHKRTWQECLVNDIQYTIPDDIVDSYIIQGVCQAEQYTLVTAYCTEVPLKYSIVMIYNQDGSLYNIIQLDDYTHAGSIAYYDGTVYVSGIGLQKGDCNYQYVDDSYPNEALIEVYSLEDFLEAKEYRQIISRQSTIYFADPEQLLFSSASTRGNSLFSFLTVDLINNEICIVGGNYNLQFQAHLVVIPLTSIQNNGVINQEQIQIYSLPVNCVQGVCVIDDTTFLITKSNGSFESNLIRCTVEESALTINNSMKIPAHAEQVSKRNRNTLIIAFENSDEAIRCFNYSKMSL